MHGIATKPEPFNGAILFKSADDMLAALFGAPQHDHHVTRRNLHIRNKAMLAAYDNANDAVAAHVRDMIARSRAGRV